MASDVMFLEHYKTGEIEFISNRKTFLPNVVNLQWVITDPYISVQLEQLYLKFGELNSLIWSNPEIESYSYMHTVREAVISNRIDGINVKLEDVLMPEDAVNTDIKREWEEVQNYISGFKIALDELERKPLSLKLFKKVHGEVFKETKGKHAQAGIFRDTIQRSKNTSLTIGPPHGKYVAELMGDIEEFIQNEYIKVPYLIRAAIMHYQIEVVKPFFFGNGRIARLMTLLYLMKKGVMKKSLLFPSMTLGKDEKVYFENINRARDKNDLYFWIRFYLSSMESAINEAIASIELSENLRKELKEKIESTWGRRAQSGLVFLNHLFKEPVVQVKTIQEVCGLSKKAANDLMKAFNDSGILQETSGQIRYRVFVFRDYVDLYA